MAKKISTVKDKRKKSVIKPSSKKQAVKKSTSKQNDKTPLKKPFVKDHFYVTPITQKDLPENRVVWNKQSFINNEVDVPRKDAVSLKPVMVPKSSLPPDKSFKAAGFALKTKIAFENVLHSVQTLREQRVALLLDDVTREVNSLEDSLKAKDNRIDNNEILKRTKKLHNMVRNVGDFVIIEHYIRDIRKTIESLCNHIYSSLKEVGKSNFK